jgi:hypothetical protein
MIGSKDAGSESVFANFVTESCWHSAAAGSRRGRRKLSDFILSLAVK